MKQFGTEQQQVINATLQALSEHIIQICQQADVCLLGGIAQPLPDAQQLAVSTVQVGDDEALAHAMAANLRPMLDSSIERAREEQSRVVDAEPIH